ncbi:hypothetical protein ACKGJI_04315 [Sulfurospirillum sp. 1307]|jgi:transposase
MDTISLFLCYIRKNMYNFNMKTKITNKEIAQLLDKSEQTIKGWKSKSPKLLELVKLGAICKLNNLDQEKIIKLSELQEVIKNQN